MRHFLPFTRFPSVLVLLGALASACAGTAPEPPAVPAEVADDGQQAQMARLYRSRTLPLRTLSLTYDDGPARATLPLARFLARKHIRATFFINGCRIQGPTPGLPVTSCTGPTQSEAVLAELARLGHLIGNHTQDHQGPLLDPALLLSQLGATQHLIDPYIPEALYVFRPPYGGWSAADTAVLHGDRGLRRLVGPVGWDVDGGDWECWRQHVPVAECAKRYLDLISRRKERNGILLLHDRPEADPESLAPLQLTRFLVHALEDKGYRFVGLEGIPGFPVPSFLDATRWSSGLDFTSAGGPIGGAALAQSVRLGDVNGDQRADACARTPDGVVCALSTGSGFAPATSWLPGAFTDADGWDAPEYGTTLQLADVDGDGRADLCGRSAVGIVCALALPGGTGFAPPQLWSVGLDFSDADGWSASPSRYGSIRFGDVNGDGKADVCGRTAGGVVCALSTGSGFSPASTYLSEEFTDAQGWDDPAYGSTLMLGDVDGDGKADVCGRGAEGVVCATANDAGTGFEAPGFWSDGVDFSDARGWGKHRARFGSLRLADMDGDGRADLCGWSPRGVVCACSNGSAFGRARLRQVRDFGADAGWDTDARGATLQLGDVDGDRKADVCAWTASGLICALAP